MISRLLLLALLFIPSLLLAQDPNAELVRIVGPLSTEHLLQGIQHDLRALKDVRSVVKVEPIVSYCLADLTGGSADALILTRKITGSERSLYPDTVLTEIPVGMQVVALTVSSDLWDARVRSVSKETMRSIYERKITNWRDAGGPDLHITLFAVPFGQGIWESFVQWMYGDDPKAPLPIGQHAFDSLDARTNMEFTQGAIAPIAAAFVNGTTVHALGVLVDGTAVTPTVANVASGRYPITRPISVVVIGTPSLYIRSLTEYLTSKAGQALLARDGAFGLDAVPKPSPTPED